MDTSFLSDEKVIEASRNFVCIRLATYEDDAEAEFLRTVYVSREGDLENTVFVLLSPDTKENLCRPGRGPQFAYSSPRDLAAGMDEIAKNYQPIERSSGANPKLPQLKDVRLGLNVSSCDGLPSVICVARSDIEAIKMQAALAPLAFCDELAGKFVYSTTTNPDELKTIKNYQGDSGYLIVNPGEFGIDGVLIGRFEIGSETPELKTAMIEYANGVAKVQKNHSAHVRKGMQNGKNWKTEIPVEDKNSNRAMGHRKQRLQAEGSGSSRRDGPDSAGSPRRGN